MSSQLRVPKRKTLASSQVARVELHDLGIGANGVVGLARVGLQIAERQHQARSQKARGFQLARED